VIGKPKAKSITRMGLQAVATGTILKYRLAARETGGIANAHELPSLARKAKRCIFPVAVLGSSGRKTTHWGLL
jgi:hypothetical protein